MKRMHCLIVVAAIMLIASPFATSAAAPVNISLWTLFTGGEGENMTAMLEQFNQEHPDIQVTFKVIEWTAYYEQLLTALLSGEGPEIAVMHLSNLPEFANMDVLMPLETLLPAEFQAKFLPNVIAKAHFNNHLYAVPIDTHPMIFFYNKAILREAGMVDSSGNVVLPSTQEELLAAAATIKEKTGKWGLLVDTEASERLWIMFYGQLGGAYEIDPATKTIKIDPALATVAYEMILKSVSNDLGPIINAPTARKMFSENQSGFMFHGVWLMTTYPTTKDLDFGVTAIPPLSGGKQVTYAGSHTLVVPKTDDQAVLKASVTFLQWFSDHTLQWAQAGHLPVNASVLSSQEFLSLPHRKDYASVGEQAIFIPAVEGWKDMVPFMRQIGQEVVGGKKTPQEAAAALQQKFATMRTY